MAIDWGVGPLPEAKAAKWEQTRARGRTRYLIPYALGYGLLVFLGFHLHWGTPHFSTAPLLGSWAGEFGLGIGLGALGGLIRWNNRELRYGLWKSSRGPLHFP